MKAIKLFILAAIATVSGAMVSCTDYQDEIDSLDKRVKTIEDMVSTMQRNLDALTAIVQGMEDNWFITNYMPIIEENKTVGYIINLRKDHYDPKTGKVIEDQREEKTIEIRNGEKGADAQFPNIEVAQGTDADGRTIYYWVVILDDGTEVPLTDGNGNPVVVAKDGKSATSPQVRVNPETGEWETSIDNGKTWQSTGVKVAGDKGSDGPQGDQGQKGDDAESAIVKIETIETTDGLYLKFTTKGGTMFILPYIAL